MLICSSSYAIRGFSYILLFAFYAGYYVNYISCSAGNMLAYWEGFTGICALDDRRKLSVMPAWRPSPVSSAGTKSTGWLLQSGGVVLCPRVKWSFTFRLFWKLRLQTGNLLAEGSGMAMLLSSCAWWWGSAGYRLLVSKSERFLPLRNEINDGSLKTSMHLCEACSIG